VSQQTTYPVLLPQRMRPWLSESAYDLIVDIGPGRWILRARPDWSAGSKQFGHEAMTMRRLDGLQRRAGSFAERAGLIKATDLGEDGFYTYLLTPKGAIQTANEDERRFEQRDLQNRWNDHLRVCEVCRSHLSPEDREWFTAPYAIETVLKEARKHASPCERGEFYEREILR
jgi:hypothetical protein